MISPFRQRSAFTLIELLTVIAIIAILSGILFAVGGAVRESTRASRAAAEISAISTALTRFHVEFGFYPEVDFIPIVDNNGFQYAPQDAVNRAEYIRSSRALYLAIQGLGYLPDEIPPAVEPTRQNRSLMDLSPSQIGGSGVTPVSLPVGHAGRSDRRIYEFADNFNDGPFISDPWGFPYGYFLRDERFSLEAPGLARGQVSLFNYDSYDLWTVRNAETTVPVQRWVNNWDR